MKRQEEQVSVKWNPREIALCGKMRRALETIVELDSAADCGNADQLLYQAGTVARAVLAEIEGGKS